MPVLGQGRGTRVDRAAWALSSGPSGGGSDSFVFFAGDGARAFDAEVVHVDAVGFAGRPGGEGGDDGAPEGDAAHDEGHVGAGFGDGGVDGGEERGDGGADVL